MGDQQIAAEEKKRKRNLIYLISGTLLLAGSIGYIGYRGNKYGFYDWMIEKVVIIEPKEDETSSPDSGIESRLKFDVPKYFRDNTKYDIKFKIPNEKDDLPSLMGKVKRCYRLT